MVLEMEDVACHKYSFVLLHNTQQSLRITKLTPQTVWLPKRIFSSFPQLFCFGIYILQKIYSQIIVSKSFEIAPFCVVMPSTRYIHGYVMYFQFIEAFKIHVLIMKCLYMIPKWNLWKKEVYSIKSHLYLSPSPCWFLFL